jgi:hypothetical protein
LKIGLLAGLLEFPTLENITQTLTEAELLERARKCFSGMLGTEIHSSDDGSEAGTGARDEVLQQLRIVSTKSLGGILHIFSHIRKSYRVCMITLEGGEDPPLLNFEESQIKTSKDKRRKTGGGDENKASAATKGFWIGSEEVAASK